MRASCLSGSTISISAWTIFEPIWPRGFSAIDKRIDEFRADTARRFEELTAPVARLEDRLWWIVGIQVGTWISIMLAILFRR